MMIWKRDKKPVEYCLRIKKERNNKDLNMIIKTFSNNKTKLKLRTSFMAKIQEK